MTFKLTHYSALRGFDFSRHFARPVGHAPRWGRQPSLTMQAKAAPPERRRRVGGLSLTIREFRLGKPARSR